ncbi:P-type conjugative transfer protein TrbL [Escherichia coli]|jgi:type IV secretion system protein TrbL|nr:MULTISPECIES: P-type conjugative transfer protein TrbL [Enterobacteriaceae]AIF64306.1 TrbL protein [Escherichia coli B7A]EDV62016.1 TrbL protein [Escherichia coli B7A]MCV8999633.1 P-type conjugative transfer protein TrbL [Escherichia coli]MCV9063034.1 P-type conjugative transfer protein TrbL [Escherichia coli]MCV9155156.1 P-type conjugative transfer protein TrbL [Escherichia coli]
MFGFTEAKSGGYQKVLGRERRTRPVEGVLIMSRPLFLSCVGIAMLLMTGSAMAAGLQSNVEMNGLLTDIHNASAQWGPKLQGYARNLLFLLAGIQFVWTFGNLIWQSADVGEMFRELIKFVMTIGFFLALLTYSTEWSTAIVNSFREAGSQASGFAQELMPGDVFTLAIKLAQKVLSNISLFDLETAVVIALSGVIILLCFAFIAAFMFVTLVESYVIINAAVLFIGFGGSQWTREFAIAPLRYAVAVGAKLFVLTLIVGLIMSVSDRWFANYDGTIGPTLTLLGLSLVCAYLSRSIPELIAGMITGSSFGGGSAIGGMAMAAAAAATGLAAGTMMAGGANAAGGAAGALGGGSGGGAGSGLADSINASMAGGQQNPAASAMPSMNSAATTRTATGGSAAAQSAGSRVGGSQAGKSPSGSGINSQSDTPRSSGLSGPQQAAQTLKKAASGANNLASVAARGLGTLAAISVPGMEGAASMGGGPPPQMPDSDEGDEKRPANSGVSADVAEETNVIRPAQEPSAAPAQPNGVEKSNNPKQESEA